jgi:hypothetical protein
MTHSEQEEVLRRALRAVADTIEPAADGLERIRQRLSKPRPLAVAWVMGAWTGLAQPLLLRMEPVLAGAVGRLSDQLAEWLRLMTRSLRAAVERLRPLGERLRPAAMLLVDAIRMLRPGSGMSRHEKLRSALAFGAAAMIGAAGGFALSEGLPQSMISAASSVFAANPPHKAKGGPGTGLGSSAQPYPQSSGTTPGSTRGPAPNPTSQCSPSPRPNSQPSSNPPSSGQPSSNPPSSGQPSSNPPSSGQPSSNPPSSSAPAGLGSTLAKVNSAATVGATPATSNYASRSVARGSSGGGPAVSTTPATGSTAKPSPSPGPSGCG